MFDASTHSRFHAQFQVPHRPQVHPLPVHLFYLFLKLPVLFITQLFPPPKEILPSINKKRKPCQGGSAACASSSPSLPRRPPSPETDASVALLIVLWFPSPSSSPASERRRRSPPIKHQIRVHRLLGVRISVKAPPLGVLPATRRPLRLLPPHPPRPLDCLLALRRHVATVTYSLSRLSELLSPIKNVRLARDRGKDAAIIKACWKRETSPSAPKGRRAGAVPPRFSALFAELTDEIVPVALESRTSLFHGTTARGGRGWIHSSSALNPSPAYEVTFLSKLPRNSHAAAAAEGEPRDRQLAAEDDRGEPWVRVHELHEEGQVHGARRKRRIGAEEDAVEACELGFSRRL
ncbi:Glycerol-3-phosphate 2-O-acyltransferase 6 [Apostasia shenzhenica]|uniref:Glycerol-3-phosphate 2-O-acyltransferase 6 n=1 Tax=Apostasia shenzhenica TaxID=1088818 RepID=A0A2I0B0U0_9ASPA|nr:Glycerol-3-phosphate 2-O-acyltransferase 6 [Apostasia shenzhenica]